MESRTQAMLEDPGVYSIANWLTMGLLDLAEGALNPNKPLSLEHWLSSLGLASALYGMYEAAKQAIALRKDNTTSSGQVDRDDAPLEGESGAKGTGELPDIQIGKSVGAKAKNYEILSPNGDILYLTEGSRITKVNVIAGNGRDRPIDMVDVLVENYGGNSANWQKCKGFGYVDLDGESVQVELHWYQEPTVGKVDFKIKKQPGGDWFSYDD